MKTPVHPGKINIDVFAVSRVCQSGAFCKSRLEKLLNVWAKQFLFPQQN